MKGLIKLAVLGIVLTETYHFVGNNYEGFIAYMKKFCLHNISLVLGIVALIVIFIVIQKFGKPVPRCCRCGSEYTRDGLYGLDCPNKCPGR